MRNGNKIWLIRTRGNMAERLSMTSSCLPSDVLAHRIHPNDSVSLVSQRRGKGEPPYKPFDTPEHSIHSHFAGGDGGSSGGSGGGGGGFGG